jgi:hypothetical protein
MVNGAQSIKRERYFVLEPGPPGQLSVTTKQSPYDPVAVGVPDKTPDELKDTPEGSDIPPQQFWLHSPPKPVRRLKL